MNWIQSSFVALVMILAVAVVSSVSPVGLGLVANYVVVAVGGISGLNSNFEIYQFDTVINGNVSEGPFNTLTHGMDVIVNGRWDYDVSGTDVPTPPGPVTGTI